MIALHAPTGRSVEVYKNDEGQSYTLEPTGTTSRGEPLFTVRRSESRALLTLPSTRTGCEEFLDALGAR